MLSRFSIWSAFLPSWLNDSPAFLVVKPIERMQVAVGAILLFKRVAPSVETIPTKISFECMPYKDLPPRQFVLRLGILTGGDKPAINLRIVKIEDHEEQMAGELAEKITAAFHGDSIPVMLGKYASK